MYHTGVCGPMAQASIHGFFPCVGIKKSGLGSKLEPVVRVSSKVPKAVVDLSQDGDAERLCRVYFLPMPSIIKGADQGFVVVIKPTCFVGKRYNTVSSVLFVIVVFYIVCLICS